MRPGFLSPPVSVTQAPGPHRVPRMHDRGQTVAPSASRKSRFFKGQVLKAIPAANRVLASESHTDTSLSAGLPGARGKRAPFSGDRPQVCPDRCDVSFMYSHQISFFSMQLGFAGLSLRLRRFRLQSSSHGLWRCRSQLTSVHFC